MSLQWARRSEEIFELQTNISEVKFVSLHELGDLPLTPLVKEVLADAGFIGEKRSEGPDASGIGNAGLFRSPSREQCGSPLNDAIPMSDAGTYQRRVSSVAVAFDFLPCRVGGSLSLKNFFHDVDV